MVRLIDVDSIPLKEALKKETVYSHDSYIHVSVLEWMLENAPTVDAEPVRHGKWTADEILYTQGMVVCSCCKTEYYRDDLYMVGNDAQGEPPNYCPNCGARMDEERKEE